MRRQLHLHLREGLLTGQMLYFRHQKRGHIYRGCLDPTSRITRYRSVKHHLIQDMTRLGSRLDTGEIEPWRCSLLLHILIRGVLHRRKHAAD